MKLGSFLFLAGVVGLVACAPEMADESDSSTGSDEIVGNVLANTAKVEKDRLIFPKSSINDLLRERINAYKQAIADGKKKEDVENVILMSDRQSDATDASGAIREGLDNPYGFLRRALSFRDEGDKTIITTEDATLEEALEELDEQQMVIIGPGDPNERAGSVRPQFTSKLDFKIPALNIHDKVVYRDGPAFVRVKTATMSIGTTVDLGVNINMFRLNHAHAIIDATVESQLIVEVGGGAVLSGDRNVDLFAASWPIGSIGPIPVTLALNTYVGCDMDVDGNLGVAGGIEATLVTHAGMTYDRGSGAKPTFDPPSFNPTVVKPTVTATAAAGAKCYLRPELSLLFAGMAGPFVAPEGYARIDAAVVPAPLKASLKGGANVVIGGKLSVFGKELGRVDKEIPVFERELWKL